MTSPMVFFATSPAWTMRRCKPRWSSSRRRTSCWSKVCRPIPTIASSMRLYRTRPTKISSRAGGSCCIAASPRSCAIALPTRGGRAGSTGAHFTQAGLTDAAIEWWGKAGDQALRRSAFQEAISHLGKAITHLDKRSRWQTKRRGVCQPLRSGNRPRDETTDHYSHALASRARLAS